MKSTIRLDSHPGLGSYLALAILATLPLFAGGCAGAKLVPLENANDFHQAVANPDKPVLVVFYKTGCPTCAALEPTLDKLADEYKGRAVIAKYRHMSPLFIYTSKEIRDEYDVNLTPTVLLFVKGQEKQRWLSDYNINDYRKALDEYCSPPAAPKG